MTLKMNLKRTAAKKENNSRGHISAIQAIQKVALAWGPFIKDVINRGGRGVCQKMIILHRLI